MPDDTAYALTAEQLAELLWQVRVAAETQVRVAEELCVVIARLQEMPRERDERP